MAPIRDPVLDRRRAGRAFWGSPEPDSQLEEATVGRCGERLLPWDRVAREQVTFRPRRFSLRCAVVVWGTRALEQLKSEAEAGRRIEMGKGESYVWF